MLGENAILLDVSDPPAVDAYGDAAGSGSVVWRGRAAAHLRRRRRQTRANATGTRLGSEGSTLVEEDELIVRSHAGAPINALRTPGETRRAQTILVEDRRVAPPVRTRFRVVDITLRSGAGTIADSLILRLADGD